MQLLLKAWKALSSDYLHHTLLQTEAGTRVFSNRRSHKSLLALAVWAKTQGANVFRIYAVLCIRLEFLELQNLMLTTTFDLETEEGKHRHFSKSEDISMRKIDSLVIFNSTNTIGNADDASYIDLNYVLADASYVAPFSRHGAHERRR